MKGHHTVQVAPQFSACYIDTVALAIPGSRGSYGVVKRAIDIVGALVGLVVLLPVLCACALLVVLDSPGPVFFRQERVGKDGRIFSMLKFRSMRAGADPAAHQDYVAAFIRGGATRPEPAAVAIPEVRRDGGLYKLAGDSRITRVGRWLRRLSLDELPQLWNVLRGDMSLVGPRPPIAYELDHYNATHMRRLLVTPGLTGLWQVSGRSRTTFEEMVALDLHYIERRSLALDVLILLKTIPVVVLGSDAR